MGLLTLTRLAGDPDALAAGYVATAATMAEVGRDHGLLAHVAARTPGGLLIVNVWPSREGSRAAAADPRRQAVVAAHGLAPADFAREHLPTIGVVLDPAGAGG